MQGAIRSTSVRTAHARSMGVFTVNSWASSMRPPPDTSPRGLRRGRRAQRDHHDGRRPGRRGFRPLWAPVSAAWSIMGGAADTHGHDCRPGRKAGGLLEIKVSAATATPGGRNVTDPPALPGWRRWLAAIGLVLVLV